MVKSTEVLGKVFGRSLFGYNKSEVSRYLENDVKKQLEDYEKIMKDFMVIKKKLPNMTILKKLF